MMDPRDARFERDGFEVLNERMSPTLIAELLAEIDHFASNYRVEGEPQVMRSDLEDRGDHEVFLSSATRVQGFLEAGALEELNTELDQGCDEERRSGRDVLNKIGHAMHDLLPAFTKLARAPITRSAFSVGQLGSTLIDQSMVIFKPPRIGGEVGWHQDATYLHTAPSRVVGVWFALEDATRDNGCLWMAPGAHRSPLRERYIVDWETREGRLERLDPTPWPRDEESVPVEVEAGSVVVFHDHMPHRSAPNLSTRSRVAVTLHGHDQSARWLPSNWLHRDELPPFVI